MKIKIFFMTMAVGMTAGCATLPSSGPTGSQVRSNVEQTADIPGQPDIALVEVDNASALPPAVGPVQWSLPTRAAPPTDIIGPGDVLAIHIYEAGVPLFGGGGAASELAGSGFDPSVKMQALPLSRVDDDGNILIPYAGTLHVVGKTVAEVQEQIRQSLRSLSQNPQILVNRERVITNSVIVAGEVGSPGRLVLDTNRENMSDVIALSGGYRGNPKDLVLRVKRGPSEARVRLSRVLDGAYGDLVAFPGDRLTVLPEPMLFSVLGASGVRQMQFTRDTMTVLEAIAAAGGPKDNSGDPKAVFLFRFTGPDKTDPVVYHFNMMEAQTYFLAQQFALRDDDILYFGNAAANQPRRLIQMISQLFAPVVTASTVANNIAP